ncbi:MAG: hypothetical protein HWE07_09105 [Cytophagia bacterium]|nr:hypothetical protein [Cytophagia bacterium]
MRAVIKAGTSEEIQLKYLAEYLNFIKQVYMANEMEVRLIFTPNKNNDWVTVEYLKTLHMQPHRGTDTHLKKSPWAK